MKKSVFSPVTSLLLSLSLALGILVCNMSDYGYLTTAHACGNGNGPATVVGETLTIDDALAPEGLVVHNIVVNGQFVENGIIAGSVRFVGGEVVNANGVIVGNEVPGGASSHDNDVQGGNETPCLNGVLVGNETPGANPGGNGAPTSNGVLVGNEIKITSGVIVSASGMAEGGTLTGDELTVTAGGIITGRNLILSGTTLNGGYINISGTITGIKITPAN